MYPPDVQDRHWHASATEEEETLIYDAWGTREYDHLHPSFRRPTVSGGSVRLHTRPPRWTKI